MQHFHLWYIADIRRAMDGDGIPSILAYCLGCDEYRTYRCTQIGKGQRDLGAHLEYSGPPTFMPFL